MEKRKEKISISLLIILGLLSAFGPFSLDMYLPALPSLATEMHVNTSMAQLSLTFCMIGLAVGQLFIGAVSDMVGRRKPLLLGLTVYFLISLLCVFVNNIVIFIILRFVQGFAGGAGSVLSRAIARDHYNGINLTKSFGILMMVNGVGPILSPIVGGAMLMFTDWRGIFVFLAIIGLVLYVVAIFSLPESLAIEHRQNANFKSMFNTFGFLLKDKSFMAYALPVGLFSGAMFAYIAASPFVLQDIYSLSPQQFSLYYAINGIGLVISSQLGSWLAIRFAELKVFKNFMIAAFIGAFVLLGLLLLDAPLWLFLLILFLTISTLGAINTVGSSLAMRVEEKMAGSASALVGLASFLFGGLVSPLVGLGSGKNGIPMGIVMLGCAVLGILFFSIYQHKIRSTKNNS